MPVVSVCLLCVDIVSAVGIAVVPKSVCLGLLVSLILLQFILWNVHAKRLLSLREGLFELAPAMDRLELSLHPFWVLCSACLCLTSCCVCSQACPPIKSHIYTFGTTILNTLEVSEVLSAMDLVITTRLYVAIHSLSVGIPVAVLAVPLSKCSYIARLYDMQFCLSVEDANENETLLTFLSAHWLQKLVHKEKIALNKLKIDNLAMKNVLVSDE